MYEYEYDQHYLPHLRGWILQQHQRHPHRLLCVRIELQRVHGRNDMHLVRC